MKSVEAIVETLKETDNEGTESPVWLLIDPKSMHETLEGVAEHGEVPDIDRVLTTMAFAIEGPFFCREDAENYLKARRYAYSSEAKVWCASGYRSQKYKALCREIGVGNVSKT